MSRKEEVNVLARLKNVLKWIANLPTAFIRVNLSHNTGTKIFSLMLAILFWFFVMDQVDPEITRVFDNVPVNLINMQELEQSNLRIMNQHDYLVSVEVTGRRNNVLNMSPKSIYLWSDMRTVRNGINNVFINRSINSDSVSIKTVMPNEIILSVERIISIPKPVRIIYNDDFQVGFYEENLTIKPEEIRVVGPESFVNSVAYVGAYVNVGTFTEGVEREISLAPYTVDGEIVNGVTLERTSAIMQLNVGMRKRMPITIEIEGEPAPGYQVVSVTAVPQEVEILGASSAVLSTDTINTEVIVLSGEETDSFMVRKNLLLPEGITHQLENGIQIEVVIEEIVTKEFVYTVEDIALINLNETFETNLMSFDEEIRIKISDISSRIDTRTKDQMSLSIDFSNVERPGIYRLDIDVSGGIERERIQIIPEYIEIVVSDAENSEEGDE